MIDIDDIRFRYQLLEEFLGERGRRLFAANEALAQDYGRERNGSGNRAGSQHNQPRDS